MTKTASYAVLTAAAVVALAGCAGRPMNQLGSVSPAGSAFDNALAQEYTGLSQVEKASGDNRDADTYAKRAMAAASGSPTMPDDPELREPIFPDKYKSELATQRARLVSALDRTGRTKAPTDAARAQAMYDCWVEQSQENLNQTHIQACRDAYMAAIEKVEAALVAGPDAYLVFFDWNKADLTPEAMQIVQSAASATKGDPSASVMATGHADTSGSANYNVGLSERRANAVRAALTKMGVAGNAISTAGKGETDPLVPTGDGVREPQNRRVEIDIKN